MANPVVKNGGAAYVPPDLLNDVSQIQDDKDYIDVVLTDLNLDTDYKMQFAWVYEDKTISGYSTVFEVTTSGVSVPNVANISSEWKGSTLFISFDRPEELVNGILTNRAKSFEISLTALNGSGVSTTGKFTQNVDPSQTRQKFELTEARMDTWRSAGNSKHVPKVFSGVIKTVNDDGVSSGLSFTTASNGSTLTGKAIADSSWNVSARLDGYFVYVNPFTDPGESESYLYTEVYQSTTLGGTYSLVTSGQSPLSVYYVSDLNTKYVKIVHRVKDGTYSLYSNVKTVASLSPSGYDGTAPSNNSTLTGGTPSVDGDGLFDFNYKVPFTWTQNSDTTTLGYKIRFRISGSSGGYTYMSVPGRSTTSTYLYGVLANQSYEVGLGVYDEYDNVSSTWSTVTITTPAFTGAITGTKALTAGDMKLGYGIGGQNANKGLYLSTNNYWYVSGNTVLDNAAVIKIGSATDNLSWDGTTLSVTGKINANSGNFTGSISVGSPTVSGQLRVIQSYKADGVTPDSAIELGKFAGSVTVAGVTTSHGIYAYSGTTGKYVLINAADASIRANNGVLGGWTISDSGISKTASYSDPIFGSTTLTTTLGSAGTISLVSSANSTLGFGDQSILTVSNALSSSSLSPGFLLLASNTALNGIPAASLSISASPMDSNSYFRINWVGGTQVNGYSNSKILWGNYVSSDQRANHLASPDLLHRPLVVDQLGIQYLGFYNYYGANSGATMSSATFGVDGDLYFSTNAN